jgi:hypothetical protein
MLIEQEVFSIKCPFSSSVYEFNSSPLIRFIENLELFTYINSSGMINIIINIFDGFD